MYMADVIPVFQGRKLSCFFLRNLFHSLMTPFLVIIIVLLNFGVSYLWVNHHNEIFSITHSIDIFKKYLRASLSAQWLRACLLMQGTRVRALVWEDPTCHVATGPVSHNY